MSDTLDNVMQLLPRHLKARADERRRVVEAWALALKYRPRHETAEAATRRFLAERRRTAGRVSRRTLYDWRDRFRRYGLVGLVDGRSLSTLATRKLDPFMQRVKRLRWRSGPLSYRDCYWLALRDAKRAGWKVPSYRSVCRKLKDLSHER